jgi:hypothetical protein
MVVPLVLLGLEFISNFVANIHSVHLWTQILCSSKGLSSKTASLSLLGKRADCWPSKSKRSRGTQKFHDKRIKEEFARLIRMLMMVSRDATVCMHERVHVDRSPYGYVCMSMFVCMHACMHMMLARAHVCKYACVDACTMYACVHGGLYVCMYAWGFICMHACTCAWMYAWV